VLGLIELRTRLRAKIGKGLENDLMLLQCDVAATVEAVRENQTRVDFSIHIIPEGDRGTEGGTTGMTISRVDSGVGILIGVKDMSDAIGSDGQDTLKLYREAVAKTLQGFTPSGTTRPLWYTDGDLIDYQDGIFWWLERFTGGFNIRENL